MNGPTVWAPYMHWAKTHPRVRYDLTGSNLLPCTLADLPGASQALQLHGPNDEGYAPLVEAIADRYRIDTERVCTATGASGANFLALAALARPGDEVVIERPTYDPLIGAARLHGLAIKRFDRTFEDGYQPDPERILAAASPRTRLIVLANLHNPSGVLVEPDRLAAIGQVAERLGARVLVDEVYLETVYDRPQAPVATSSDTFISTNSLTKSFGLAGLRCGWAIAEPGVAEAIRRTRDVVDAVGSFPSDSLASLAFGQIDSLLERARTIIGPNLSGLRALIEHYADRIDCVAPQGGPGAFPRLRDVDDSLPFVGLLRDEFETGVVPGLFFEAPAHFRVAVGGDPAVVAAGLQALGRALESWTAD